MGIGLRKRAPLDLSGNVHLVRDLIGVYQGVRQRRGRRSGALNRRLGRESAEIMATFVRTYLDRTLRDETIQVTCEQLPGFDSEPVHVIVRKGSQVCAVIRLLADLGALSKKEQFGLAVRQLVERYRKAGFVPDQLLLVIGAVGGSLDMQDVEGVVGPVSSRGEFLTDPAWRKRLERYITVLKRRADALPDPCRQIRVLSVLDQLAVTADERERLMQAAEEDEYSLWVDPIDAALSYVEARCRA